MSSSLSPQVLREALTTLAGDRALFASLCTPGKDGVEGSAVPGDILDALERSGIVEREGVFARPRLWVVLRGDRPYVMSLNPAGVGDEYHQDVWPETEALLGRLGQAPVGTLLDVGTGSGVIAVEAALRGHRVTATDVFPSALAIARLNAEMHGVDVELLAGHLFRPVRGRTFDLILSAPHYTPPYDLLRVEALRSGVDHVAPGGAFVVATFLEWFPGEAPGVVTSVLAPLAQRAAVAVLPIVSDVKKRWFTVPDPHPPHVPARHRFLVDIVPGAAPGLRFEPPATTEREVLVPLSRLVGGRARREEVRVGLDGATSGAWDRNVLAEIVRADDVDALGALLEGVARGSLVIPGPVPFRLLDGCRFGERRCVDAHGAIVDGAGGVRPCSRGGVVGWVTDFDDELQGKMLSLRAALEARRGCQTCSALAVCGQCAFPFVVDEHEYCRFMREHAGALRRTHNLLKILADRWSQAVRAPELRVKLAPGAPRIAAGGPPPGDGPADAQIAPLGAAFTRWGVVLVLVPGERAALEVSHPEWSDTLDIAPAAAGVAELAIDGAPRAALYAAGDASGVSEGDVDMLVLSLYAWLS